MEDRPEEVIWHTKSRSRWDSRYLERVVAGLKEKRSRELKNPEVSLKRVKSYEGNIIEFMKRLNYLHQEKSAGRIHKYMMPRDMKKYLATGVLPKEHRNA